MANEEMSRIVGVVHNIGSAFKSEISPTLFERVFRFLVKQRVKRLVESQDAVLLCPSAPSQ